MTATAAQLDTPDAPTPDARDSGVWAVIGSSLSRPQFFLRAVRYADHSITTNDGINEFLGSMYRNLYPDYYLLNDQVACQLYGRYAQTARQCGGTQILSPDRQITAMVHEGVRPDDVLPVRWDLGEGRYRPGDYTAVRASGLYCLQFAVHQGASTVLLLGHEGYASKPGQILADNCGGVLGHDKQGDRTLSHMAPFLHSVIESCPHVRFVFCGKPHLMLAPDPDEIARRWPNVTVCRTTEDFRHWTWEHTMPETQPHRNHPAPGSAPGKTSSKDGQQPSAREIPSPPTRRDIPSPPNRRAS